MLHVYIYLYEIYSLTTILQISVINDVPINHTTLLILLFVYRIYMNILFPKPQMNNLISHPQIEYKIHSVSTTFLNIIVRNHLLFQVISHSSTCMWSEWLYCNTVVLFVLPLITLNVMIVVIEICSVLFVVVEERQIL